MILPPLPPARSAPSSPPAPAVPPLVAVPAAPAVLREDVAEPGLPVELEALLSGGHVRTDVRHDSGVVQARCPGLDGAMDTSATLPELDETLLATTRYLQALTQLDDESARRPSVLPGWSRGHVAAHLEGSCPAGRRSAAS